MRVLKYFLFSLLLLSSCDKFDWYNPYDPECPKELFTPSSPGATMEGNSVKLIWSQENDNISGFNIYRSAEGESITSLTQPQKSATQYLDASVTPGKKYTYYVLAVAGTNKSDTIKAEITPVFPITINTGAVTELAATSAKVSGNITSAGGGAVISRGICWSTTPNPTVSNSKTTEGTGAGQYTSTLNGLLAATTYYARAYGENSRGIVYGSQVTFTTLGPPTLTTTAVSTISATSATSGGAIISDGGSPITAKGVVWSTSPNPTIDLATKTNDGTGVGAFTSTISNLANNTRYYIRSYATNIVGTSYGEEQSFTTITPVPQITIGVQIWTSKNSDVTKYRNGDPIPQVTDPTQWANLTTGAWCWYNNDSAKYASTYGKLYNWYAVIDPRGLAPIGWHVPTNSDWKKLVKYLDPSSDTTCNNCTLSAIVGGFLKETGVLNWDVPNLGATNSTGFTAVPGGDRSYISINNFQAIKGYGGYWSATESDNTNSSIIVVYSNTTNVNIEPLNKRYGWSVRFIKD